MHLHPYLHFKAECEAAFKFYQQVLGGKIEAMIPYEGSPGAEHVPPDWRKKIMHARLAVDGMVLMGSDPPAQYYAPMKGFAVAVTLGPDQAAEADRIFGALAQDGTVTMPIQETFWANRFGMLVDRFGTPWMISCDKAA